MAFEADQRLGLRGELLVIKQFCYIAFVTRFAQQAFALVDRCDGQAAGAVAGFAIYQRQPGFRLDLLTMDAVPEEVSDLVVLVALGHAVVCADIIGVQAADNHFFVFSHRQQRSGLFHAGASTGKQQGTQEKNRDNAYDHGVGPLQSMGSPELQQDPDASG